MEEKETLYGRLNSYSGSDYYPFHMPGHKRNERYSKELSPYMYDITEIDGFDNLHAPEDILKQRMDKVSAFYESERSYYLVNGSTCGILAAISAAADKGKRRIIMARNSHKAAYNAVLVNGLQALYIYPDIIEKYGISGGINRAELDRILREQENTEDIAAVYITSPTYEGVVSDIASIGSICHSYGIPLIVDEAHGAHFSMHESFPASSLEKGADIVIQSLHKTLPSLTQTAILHIGKQSVIQRAQIERYLSVYQTSSPSYVLMSAIDRCLDELMQDTFWSFEILRKRIEDFREKAAAFTNIELMGNDIVGKNSVFAFDISKLVIFPRSGLYSGQVLYDTLLEKYHLQMEMASLKYIIAMTSIMDTQQGFDRLYMALEEIDREIRVYERPQIPETGTDRDGSETAVSIRPIACRSISEAAGAEQEDIPIDSLEGRISGDFVYLYPPGIPLIAPGEMFSGELIAYIKRCSYDGLKLVGLKAGNTMAAVIKESFKSLSFQRIYMKQDRS